MITTYIELGLDHILDLQGYDHMLFLWVLVVPFAWKNWKSVLGLVTAFTIGHAFTLTLTTLGVWRMPSAWIEWLISMTIFLTAFYHFFKEHRTVDLWIYVVALLFGFIHGMGFAGYLATILGDDIFWPLLGFNVGVELGQVIFVLIALSVRYILVDMLGIPHVYWRKFSCLVVMALSAWMIFDRL